MRRRQFAVAAAATALAACTKRSETTSTSRTSKTYNWRLVMAIPKTLPIWGPGVERFAERVSTISGGALNIRVFGAGELVPALGVFDAVKAGQVEMGHSASYYWQGKIEAAPFFTAVPFGMNPVGMRAWLDAEGQALWDEVYAPHGVLAMPAGNTGLQMGGWFNKEINSIADYRGLKMRIPGLGGKVIAKAGAKPMLVPGGEIYTNLSTGVIDATEWVGPYHDYVMGFHKAAKYYYYPGWHEPGPVLELMINRKAWDELPKELKELVRTCAAEADKDIYSQWVVKDAEYFKKIVDEGKVELRQFPNDVLRQLKTYSDEVLAEVAASSPLAKRVHESFTKFQASFDAHQNATERAYMQFQSSL